MKRGPAGFALRLLLVLVACSMLEADGRNADELPAPLQEVLRRFPGRVGLAARHLESGRSLLHNADERFQTASVIKIPVMVEAFAQARAGKLRLDEPVTTREGDRVPGSGILKDLEPGLRLTLMDAVILMIVLSDNQATNLVIDRVGIGNVNERMRILGLPDTRLFKKVFLPPEQELSEDARRFGLGVTTPRDMLRLMEMLAEEWLVDADHSRRMIGILKKQRDADQIPRFLSRVDLGGKVEVANKTGALETVRNDVGIVFSPRGRFVVAVFCQESPDRKWTADNEATLTSARLAEAAIRHLASAP